MYTNEYNFLHIMNQIRNIRLRDYQKGGKISMRLQTENKPQINLHRSKKK